MKPIGVTGNCICGVVGFTTKIIGESIGACHCDICRKWGGGPLFAFDCGNECHFSGEDSIIVFPTTQWAERGFCLMCGTHIFIRVKRSNHYIMPAGLFEIDEGMKFDHQIFVDKKPNYYCFENSTTNKTSEEFFSEFA